MGYSFGLMLLLEELCALAEDVWGQTLQLPLSNAFLDSSTRKPSHEETSSVPAGTNNWSNSWCSDLLFRSEPIRMRLESWKPTISSKHPYRSSRKFASKDSNEQKNSSKEGFGKRNTKELELDDSSADISGRMFANMISKPT
ncbi:uncharacterized protein LY79DRAFT_579038 [Colletotrichum navitas]|uniref:Uncharacterized protein n=1 Tax=Colletotrichum navitas TaxID=681940 RepID=A0AAD8Q2V4_9PEZI|nr:uncharacterized protein LY79DRAFT_579038 [Colletotrichum navitas]KAK1593819.1 hypothetical protein LY79DRAFT_579038 [Colletotrichum navitas]